MLVAERRDDYRIVAQTEHANQVGRMAAHWGNETFDPPEPGAPTTAAAYLHDNGWWGWDLSPHLGDGAPVNLFDVRPEQWATFYTRGIDNALGVDPYAGLLVSMHGSGVRRRRYGTRPSMPLYEDSYAEFIADQERRQRRVLDELLGSGRYGDHVDPGAKEFLTVLHETGGVDAVDGDPPRIWTNYKLLQAWDRLSLHCCLDDVSSTAEVAPVPAGPDTDVEIDLHPVDDTTVRVAPYPFDTAPLTLPVRGRSIPNVDYADEADLVDAYYTADQRSFPFTFVRE